MENWPSVAETPAIKRDASCHQASGAWLKIINGTALTQEKTEKQNTISGPGAPCLAARRTLVYASPAPIPPMRPRNAGKVATLSKPGRNINIAPTNATITQPSWYGLIVSFIRK